MLKGERISLRPLELSDVDLLYQWENNPRIWRISNTQAPFSKESLRSFIKRSHDIYTDKQLRFIIASGTDDAPLGTLDLFDCDFNNKRCGIGILIADKENRRRGYGYESLEMIKIYARDILDFHQLYANILVSNEESLALFKKAGFEVIGEKKDWVRIGDEFENETLLQVILKA